ncbi:hypothetical protein J2T19_005241 [Paenibacillus tundrae]|uniref:Uncharacterized protein n=1 Tax=Paenibacillus tundrae TaxID=528187 RepID=A0ABT9WKN3_9BACL|nr:hypothetical protein [Paenibacillus tundrae]
MYLIALVTLVITGLVAISHIVFDLKALGDGIALLVKMSNLLFWLSLLFFVHKMPTKPRKRNPKKS